MADEAPPGEPPSVDPLPGWPYQPADLVRPASEDLPAWVGAAPQSGRDWAQAAPQSVRDWAQAAPQSVRDWAQAAPQSVRDGEGIGAPGAGGIGAAPPARRRRLVVGVVAAVLVIGAVTVGALASRRGERRAAEPKQTSAAQAPQATSGRRLPGPPLSLPPPTGSGTELTLMAGRVVVAARPGWEGLESFDDTASVRLALRGPAGRDLLTTMTIATLSSADSLDTTLKLDGGTSFEVKGPDRTLRVTVQPGPAARIVAGTVSPRGIFFVNLSIFALDGQDLDAPTLRTLFTDQVAPALRFP